MRINRLTACLISQIILGLLLVSCLPVSKGAEPTAMPPDLMDQSWLTDIPCKAPCWYGLESGKSSKKEALSKVKELPFVNADSVDENFIGPATALRCKALPQGNCAYMRFDQDTLSQINTFPNYEITFEQVVDRLGTPDGFEYSRINPEGKGCFVILLWVERQMTISYHEGSRRFFEKDLCDRIQEADNKVPLDLLVGNVCYMQKSEAENITTKREYKIWNGFIPE